MVLYLLHITEHPSVPGGAEGPLLLCWVACSHWVLVTPVPLAPVS